jgi:hypothetical protein
VMATKNPLSFLMTLPALLMFAAAGQAGTIAPNACGPVVVTPCMAANLTGPILITDPAQLQYQIVLNNGGIQGTLGAGGASSSYQDGNGMLAADPNAVIAQNAANTAALLLAGNAPIAPNPGGALVVTNSTTTYITGTFVDTAFSQRVDQYQTTIEALLNGGSSVFQQTFNLPFSDPAVQAAVAQADLILAGDGAVAGPPTLASNVTSLLGDQFSYLTTGLSLTGAQEVTVFTTFGPNSIAVGENGSDLFTVIPGQSDINVNSENFYATDRNVTDTSTYLTSQTYSIDGLTGPSSAVPEPGTAGLLICAAFCCFGTTWRKVAGKIRG